MYVISQFKLSVSDLIFEEKSGNESHCKLLADRYIHTRPQSAFGTKNTLRSIRIPCRIGNLREAGQYASTSNIPHVQDASR